MHFAFSFFSMLKYHYQKLLNIINSHSTPHLHFPNIPSFFQDKNKWLGTAWFIILEKVNLSCLKSGVSPNPDKVKTSWFTQKQFDFFCMVCQFIQHFGQYSVNLIRNVKSVSIIACFLYSILKQAATLFWLLDKKLDRNVIWKAICASWQIWNMEQRMNCREQ